MDIAPSKWDMLKKDLITVDQQLREKSCKWKVGSLLLLVGLPFFLVIFQIFIRAEIIPADYTISHLWLNFSQPNLSAMFATNYIHDVWLPEHVIGNATSFFGIIYVTFILYFIIIPILKIHNILHFEYSDNAFFGTVVIYLIGLPIAISGISILFGRMLSQTGGWGFSGIVWAFNAYLFFLILVVMYDYILHKISIKCEDSTSDSINAKSIGLNNNSGKKPTIVNVTLTLIFINFLVIVLPVYAILLDIGNKKIGVFVHLAGFTLGLFAASLIMMICEERKVKSQIGLFTILLSIIILSSICWLFFGK